MNESSKNVKNKSVNKFAYCENSNSIYIKIILLLFIFYLNYSFFFSSFSFYSSLNNYYFFINIFKLLQYFPKIENLLKVVKTCQIQRHFKKYLILQIKFCF
ncbi:hypothetical protein EDEG_03902 [Edhazardia aedis USNM 41457]|uniref:Transmembrane protein n=1 Tax=Edhazardia aedis (strain USNM 41457) TaxID=1003232 RepID=J8ZP84_EDHAE|nr:hypothetical protein EDEG_03902 [Edhazardia aedis USNM 41457]|eukprot:EJW01523.1 hypothetical protein EDEG_03902 [Edhazardia aedis USNM 41457]